MGGALVTGNLEEISQTKLLLCEGAEDVLFFNALLAHLQIITIQVEPYGGKPKLHAVLKALPKRPDFSTVNTLAITRDAEIHLQSFTPQSASLQNFCHREQKRNVKL